MKKSPSASVRLSPASQFLREIEKAEADGVAREDMVLQLTYSDAQQIKRDSSLAVADVSFSEGVMRFLGVKVEQGGVSVSALQRERLDSAASGGK